MQPTLELLRQLRREEIDDARQMSPETKLHAGGDLFDAACQVTISGIRFEHPDWSDAQVLEELGRRLAMARRLETRA
jgi:Rv0078B-related antitoxin